MMTMRKKMPFTPIGLDISDTTLSAVQFAREAGSVRLHAALTCNIDANGDAAAADGKLRDALTALIASGRFVGREVVGAMPRTDVDIRPVTLPEGVTARDGQRFTSALRDEARGCLLYKPEDAVIDYLPLNTGQEAVDGQAKVLLVAARREVLNRYLAAMKAVGLKCAHLDVAPCAAARLLEKENSIYTLIDLDRRCSVISIARGGDLLFSRTLKFGMTAFVDAVAEGLEVPASEAEAMLRSYGIARPESHRIDLDVVGETGCVDPGVISATLFEMCGKAARYIAAEAKRSIDYFALHRYGGKVERAYLLGAFLPMHLDTFLSDRLSIPVSPVHVPDMSSEPGSRRNDESGYVVAAGLALRSES